MRIIALYIIPISLLISILPWDKAGLDESVFAAAVTQYGLRASALFFAFVILICGHPVLEPGPLRRSSRTARARAHGHGTERTRPHQQERHAVALHPRLSICACWAVILPTRST